MKLDERPRKDPLNGFLIYLIVTEIKLWASPDPLYWGTSPSINELCPGIRGGLAIGSTGSLPGGSVGEKKDFSVQLFVSHPLRSAPTRWKLFVHC